VAHLWIASEDKWSACLLDAAVHALVGGRLHRLVDPARLFCETPDAVALLPVGRPASDRWALVSGPAVRVRVNGLDARLGIHALVDRDEIRIANGAPLFFSTETLAVVEVLPPSAPRTFCPRCKQAIEADTPAVRCPACGLWHHQAVDLECWTYGPRCAACPCESSLDSGFNWTPEDL
jgi:hypothetical protein